MKLLPETTHQKGELKAPKKLDNFLDQGIKLPVDTFGGRVHVEWDPQAAVTRLGQLPFFIEFLKLGNLFDPWVKECPLKLTSPNAPSKKLMGWEKSRRVIVLRKKVPKDFVALSEDSCTGQLQLSFAEIDQDMPIYEYAVLVTSLSDEVLAIAQHYRDWADSENIFDELKNQWGWGGFTTQDLKRCRLMGRVVGLIYNWWNLFTRLAEPNKHLEAITSRPLLLHAVGKQTTHSGQTMISISSTHGKIQKVQKLLNRLVTFFKTLKEGADQLTPEQRWYRILSRAIEKYLNGRELQPPIGLPIMA